MTVLAPGDGNEVGQLFAQALKLGGPSYMRIGRYGEPELKSAAPVVLGKARLLAEGERVAILSAADMGSVVIDAVERLRAEGMRPAAYQIHTIKPLDTETLDALAKKVDVMITVEEHIPVGGLSAAVGLWLEERAPKLKLVRIGAPDAQVLGSPGREELRRSLKLDAGEIAAACRRHWRS
jgi:transketolase